MSLLVLRPLNGESQLVRLVNRTFDVTVGNRTFQSNAAMAKQAELFPQFASQLAELDCEIAVYGDGLLPYIARLMSSPS